MTTHSGTAAGIPTARELVSDVYTFLITVIETAGLDRPFSHDLIRLLGQAQARDQESPVGAPALLPLLACEAAGGEAHQALPTAAAWRALDLAGKVLDDVEDGDAARSAGSGEVPRLLNLAPGFYSASVICLAHLPDEVYLDLSVHMHRVMLRMVGAQHREFALAHEESVEGCLRTNTDKTGASFALAARLGARCATSEPACIQPLDEFGLNAGVMLQLLDDLADFRMPGSDGDIASGRRKLPVVYSLVVAPIADRLRLESLLKRSTVDPMAEAEARQLMIALGAEVHLMSEIARYHRRALEALEQSRSEEQVLSRLRIWLSSLHSAAEGL